MLGRGILVPALFPEVADHFDTIMEIVEINLILDMQNQTAALAAEFGLSALGRRIWEGGQHHCKKATRKHDATGSK